jgi:serine/threonine protein kinase
MTGWIQVIAGGFRWQLLPQWRDHLVGPQGLRLAEWIQAGQAEVVKQGPHRTVYRVHLPDLAFYLKHFRLHDVQTRLRQLLRPAQARLEYEQALAVAGRGIPTIVPLAFGESAAGSRWGDSYLLTSSLEDGESLSTFFEFRLPTYEPNQQTRLRQRLARELATVLARLHDAGIVHHDLHPGNLLVRQEAGNDLQVFVIDLHAVRLGQPLDWAARRTNLAMLNRWFILRSGRTDRLRFWRAYFHETIGSAPEECALPRTHRYQEQALDLERETWLSSLRFWRHRDRRCLRNNRYYIRVQSPAAHGHAVRDLDAAFVGELLGDPDAPFRQPGARLLKDSRSSTVMELEAAVDGTLHSLIYKRFRATAWSDPWTALFRPTPALRSWLFGHGLRERGLPTPRPLAVFHRRRRGMDYEGYLLTEKVPDALDLHGCSSQLGEFAVDERRKILRRWIDQLAVLIRQMHCRHLAHRDLKAANILLSKKAGEAALDRFWLIDLVGLSRHRQLPMARRIQNLARLHASFHRHPALTRSDRLRFLQTYLQWGLFGRGGWKKWWQAIEETTSLKIERNQRRGRPLA